MRKPKQEKYAYDARVALWLSRDPIGERGGVNLYGMVGNNPVNAYDILGLISRKDIENGRTVYSVGAGWIDSAHVRASEQGTRRILAAMLRYEADPSNTPWTDRTATQTGNRMSSLILFNYTGTPSAADRFEIALGIEMQFQIYWEHFQGTWLRGNFISKSSFSVEDLPSDYLGVMIGAGVFSSEADMMRSMDALNKEESLCVWDMGEGPLQNRSHKPILWKLKGTGVELGSVHWVFNAFTPRTQPNGFYFLSNDGHYSIFGINAPF